MCYHAQRGAQGGPALFALRSSGEDCLSTAIRFEHVSKRFTLHHQRPRSFQELVIQLFKGNGNVSGQSPATEAASGQRHEAFWALRDVSFTVEQGETVGIIGPNGAGKSTVLKLVSRIIEPTSGEIEVNGRIGALLELGAGFHPDLSGLENIYLNSSILGLGRHEIEAKVDEIISFAELERFIDMPIRHYSSGMRMRLGFSIAAHIDPEILLVDEVLAVGDETFQHKCLDRIMEMRQQGVTICFVSHGLGQVRRLCSRALWLNDGTIQVKGKVDDVISAYLRFAADEEESRMKGSAASVRICKQAEKAGAGEVGPVAQTDEIGVREEGDDRRFEILGVTFVDSSGAERQVFEIGEAWGARILYRASKPIESLVLGLTIDRNDGQRVCTSRCSVIDLKNGHSIAREGSVQYSVEKLPLMEGTYLVSVSVEDESGATTFHCDGQPYRFKVRQVGRGERYGLASLGGTWHLKTQENSPLRGHTPGNGGDAEPCVDAGSKRERRWGTADVEVTSVSFIDASGAERRVFEAGEAWTARLRYRTHRRIEEPTFGLAVHRDDGVHVCGPNTYFAGLDKPLVEGGGEVLYRVEHLPLLAGTYHVSVSAHNRADTVMYDYHDRLYTFKVCQFDSNESEGVVMLRGRWEWNGRR